jgi:hypothetical protein
MNMNKTINQTHILRTTMVMGGVSKKIVMGCDE